MSFATRMEAFRARFAELCPTENQDLSAFSGVPYAPPVRSQWARLVVTMGSARIAGFGGGRIPNEHTGVVTVSMFGPPGQDIALLWANAAECAAIFRHASFGGIQCHESTEPRNVTAPGSQWIQFNTTTNFHFYSFYEFTPAYYEGGYLEGGYQSLEE